MLAMDVSVTACLLIKRGALGTIASKLAPARVLLVRQSSTSVSSRSFYIRTHPVQSAPLPTLKEPPCPG
ncbi:hypothetical protein EQV97_02860 [Pseudomonas sp. TMW22090]|nr:hypothetical protein [Pseudomonas sp. TMW22090]